MTIARPTAYPALPAPLPVLSADDARLAAFVETQPTYRFDHAGGGPVQVVAATQAARTLSTTLAGAALQRGLAALVDGRAAARAAQVQALTLSTSPEAWTTNQRLSMLESMRAFSGQDRFNASEMEELAAIADAHSAQAVATTTPTGHIILNAAESADLVRALTPGARIDPAAAGEAMSTTAHEVEHTVTPDAPGSDGPGWIEEGTAELLATHRMPKVAAAFGVRDWTYESKAYPELQKSLTVLLSAAGLDPARDVDTVDELLQTLPLPAVPDALAQVIARRSHLSDAGRDQLAAGIRELDGSDAAAARALLERVGARPH